MLEHGTGVSLEITCILDPNNEVVRKLLRDDQTEDGNANTSPSQRIAFFKNSERVSKHYVTVVNSTAAHLRIPDPPAGHATYYCTLLLGKQALAANRDYNVDQSLSPASDDSSTSSTVLPTSLETSGPPPLVSHKSEAGVCLNSVSVGCKLFDDILRVCAVSVVCILFDVYARPVLTVAEACVDISSGSGLDIFTGTCVLLECLIELLNISACTTVHAICVGVQ